MWRQQNRFSSKITIFLQLPWTPAVTRGVTLAYPPLCLWFLTPLCCCLSARWPSRALLQSKVDPGPSSPPWAAPCRGRSPLPLPSHFPSITDSSPCRPTLCKLPPRVLSWNSRILCQGKSIRATHALSASFRVRLWGVNPDWFGVHSVSFWWLSELFPHL